MERSQGRNLSHRRTFERFYQMLYRNRSFYDSRHETDTGKYRRKHAEEEASLCAVFWQARELLDGRFIGAIYMFNPTYNMHACKFTCFISTFLFYINFLNMQRGLFLLKNRVWNPLYVSENHALWTKYWTQSTLSNTKFS